MKVRILRHVPGTVDHRYMCAGDEVTVPVGTGVSLIADGYAELIRETPAERRTTRKGGS